MRTSPIWRKKGETKHSRGRENKTDLSRSDPDHGTSYTSSLSLNIKVLKYAREKCQSTYRGTPIRLRADFSEETFYAKREWRDIFQILKEKNCHPRITYSAKLSLVFEIKYFQN